jgi:competence protein ComEA
MEAELRRRPFVAGIVIILAGHGAAAQTARPATPAASPAASLVDLNGASRDALMSLDGIGEVRADAIIRARPFKAKTELVERRLIPEALYDKIAGKVTVRPIPATPPTPQVRGAPAPATTRR